MMDKLKAVWTWLGGFQTTARAAVLCALVGFVVGGAVCKSWRQAVIDSPAPPHAFGWDDRPEHVAAVVKSFKHPFFGDAAKPLIQGDTDKDAFLWQAYEKVTGHPWKPHNQFSVGSCVGHGWSASLEILTCVEIALNGEAQEYKPISAASVYALSRELGDFLGNQDGSTGADAAKACMTLGSLSSEDAGDDNHDGSIGPKLCKQWGRTGMPRDKKPHALEHKIATASQVRTPEEVRAALVNGYVVPICSSVGFEGRGGFKRDADGFCWPGGSWPHCMTVCAYRKDKRAFMVLQSWGASMPPGPKSLGQPDGSFWISWEAMQKVVRTGECYAISGFDGFRSRDLDWRVEVPERAPRRVAAHRNLLAFPLAW